MESSEDVDMVQLTPIRLDESLSGGILRGPFQDSQMLRVRVSSTLRLLQFMGGGQANKDTSSLAWFGTVTCSLITSLSPTTFASLSILQ